MSSDEYHSILANDTVVSEIFREFCEETRIPENSFAKFNVGIYV